MPKKFRELVAETMTDEERATARAESQALSLEMNLRELREKLSELSQEDIAQLLNVTQPYISKLERQKDMLVSKLYDYVSTLGGEVEIRAKFSNYDVVVSQFDELAKVFQVKDRHQGSGTSPRRQSSRSSRSSAPGSPNGEGRSKRPTTTNENAEAVGRHGSSSRTRAIRGKSVKR